MLLYNCYVANLLDDCITLHKGEFPSLPWESQNKQSGQLGLEYLFAGPSVKTLRAKGSVLVEVVAGRGGFCLAATVSQHFKKSPKFLIAFSKY